MPYVAVNLEEYISPYFHLAIGVNHLFQPIQHMDCFDISPFLLLLWSGYVHLPLLILLCNLAGQHTSIFMYPIQGRDFQRGFVVSVSDLGARFLM